MVELSLDLPGLPCARRLLPADPDASYIEVVKVNVEYVVHSYKSVIGNSVHKMLVISRTRYRCIQEDANAGDACLLTHSDVLMVLLVSVVISTACLLNMAVGSGASDSRAFFLVQFAFCVFACPTLALAVRVPPSKFLGDYLGTRSASLLLRCIFAVIATETLFVFWFYV